MLGLRITMEGVDVVSRRLEGIASRISDLSPAWPAVLEAILQRMTLPAFASEGASTDDGAWPALARSTQLERARLGYDPTYPILQRTTNLMTSLTSQAPTPVGQMLWLTTPMTARFGTTVPYFKYHQSRRPRKKIPRRAPVSPTQADKHAIVHPIRLWVTGQMPEGYRGEERIPLSELGD